MTAIDDELLAAVRRAAGSVPDPELPVVSLEQLGMVHDVRWEDDRVVVELLPTFSGCPATEMMGRDVRSAVRERVDGVDEVGVRWLFQPVWSTDRINDEGRARLKEFGIAPPTGGGTVSTLERPAGAVVLPITDRAADTAGGGGDPDGRRDPDESPEPPVSCPYCDSTAVVEDSPFGPTPCRAAWFCRSCIQPFERFKPL